VLPRYKDSIDFTSELLKVAGRRIRDYRYRDISGTDADKRALLYLKQSPEIAIPPRVSGLIPTSSIARAEYLKNMKFTIGSLNAKLKKLEEAVESGSRSAFASLHSLQREIVAAAAEISEEEIKKKTRYSKVHVNASCRDIDAQLQYEDRNWLSDFKTGLSYREKYLANIYPLAGITLPIKSIIDVPLADAVVIDESADVGDSLVPLLCSPARNIFLPDKVFRYIIQRREYDTSSRLYKQKTSFDTYPHNCVATCTIQLELASPAIVNYLCIEPLGCSTLMVRSISVITEAGEELEFTTMDISSETLSRFLFQPALAKYVKIKFEQRAPVSKTSLDIEDRETRLVNEVLTSAGLSVRLPTTSEEIQGRLYDFSMKGLALGFVEYQNKGIFRGHPVAVDSPLGLDLRKEAEAITPVEYFDAYNNTYILPDDEVIVEGYVGALLRDRDGNERLNALIPVPDSYPMQVEFLAPLGTEARVKLFPDCRWTVTRNCVKGIELIEVVHTKPVGKNSIVWTEQVYEFSFEEAHGFGAGSEIGIIAPESTGLGGIYTIDTAVSETVFQIKGSQFGVVELDGLEDMSICVYDTEYDAPIQVFENATLLSLGTDYQISLDDKVTWLSEWPVDGSWSALYERAIAGTFWIKFDQWETNIDRKDCIYWTRYRVLKDQKLVQGGRVGLRNGRVLFGTEYADCAGTFSTVLVFRTNAVNPYLTTIVRAYRLLIQERERKNTRKTPRIKRFVKLARPRILTHVR
jgi:hypothetical protein